MNPSCKRLLCNALIQTTLVMVAHHGIHYLIKRLQKRFQTTQNKCIRYCLDLPSRSHISATHFRKINWLPVDLRVQLCTATTVYKYWNQLAPSYFNDIFTPSLNRYNTRSQMALDIPLRKAALGQKNISFLGPKVWSKISNDLKVVKTTNCSTHGLKKVILNNMIT